MINKLKTVLAWFRKIIFCTILRIKPPFIAFNASDFCVFFVQQKNNGTVLETRASEHQKNMFLKNSLLNF